MNVHSGRRQLLQQRHPLPLEVGGEDDLAGPHIQDAGHHHAHGAAQILPLVLPEKLLQAVHHPGEHPLGHKVPLRHRNVPVGRHLSRQIHNAQVELVPGQKQAGAEHAVLAQGQQAGRAAHLTEGLRLPLLEDPPGDHILHDSSHGHDVHARARSRLRPGQLPL